MGYNKSVWNLTGMHLTVRNQRRLAGSPSRRASRETPMLTLTTKATRHLIEVRRKRGFDAHAGARFVAKGARVGLTFVRAPGKEDRVVESEQIKVYVAPDIADALDRAIIDAREVDGNTALVMRKRESAKSDRARVLPPQRLSGPPSRGSM